MMLNRIKVSVNGGDGADIASSVMNTVAYFFYFYICCILHIYAIWFVMCLMDLVCALILFLFSWA